MHRNLLKYSFQVFYNENLINVSRVFNPSWGNNFSSFVFLILFVNEYFIWPIFPHILKLPQSWLSGYIFWKIPESLFLGQWLIRFIPNCVTYFVIVYLQPHFPQKFKDSLKTGPYCWIPGLSQVFCRTVYQTSLACCHLLCPLHRSTG